MESWLACKCRGLKTLYVFQQDFVLLMIRFLLIFVLLLPSLMILELTAPAQHWVVLPWTSLLTQVTAFLLSFFDQNVISNGKVLQNAQSGVGVSVEAGCNGVEACLILLAAIFAYPAPWMLQLMGILAGSWRWSL